MFSVKAQNISQTADVTTKEPEVESVEATNGASGESGEKETGKAKVCVVDMHALSLC
jgi:hypothetical protein